MATLYVQFTDETETKIIAYFVAPQDPVIWPNNGTVEQSDQRWHDYYYSQPEWAQAYLPTPL